MTQALKPAGRSEKTHAAATAAPNAAALGRWLRSWVQPSGAIHGFHNHTVWGDSPYYYQEMSCAHTTFASPMIVGLAHALRKRPDPRGQELIERLIGYQVSAVAEDGQFKHIGFNAGELCQIGLVHNVVPLMAINAAVRILGDRLAPALREGIERTTRRVMETCDERYKPLDRYATANQDYVRIWARQLYTLNFGNDFGRDSCNDLREIIRRFHVPGLPDAESCGVLRNSEEQDDIEPTEYYGLMINPLLLGYQQSGDKKLFDAALSLCRHVVRGAWTDSNGATRFHRTWHRVRGQWHKLHEPMLIGGMGVTLSGMEALVAIRPDAEIEDFIVRADTTYARYQTPYGFFLSASGWGDWRDLIPSTAWQSHDFFHLCARQPIAADFWDQLFQPYSRIAAVLGQTYIWYETDTHFSVRGYHWASAADLIGRKDHKRFYVDIPSWIGFGPEIPPDTRIPDEPVLLRTTDGVIPIRGSGDVDFLCLPGTKVIP